MTSPDAVTLTPLDGFWPTSLSLRLGKAAPVALQVIGPVSLLAARRTALFGSTQTPGAAILRAHDTARRLRDEGITLVGGFHSPLEKECFQILLRGDQPIIICLARTMAGMRIPTACQAAFEAGRLLFLSPFLTFPKRITRESALRRSEVVAALADEVFFAHVTPGGHTARMAEMIAAWGTPIIHPGTTPPSTSD
ncbi:MAG TPA: hypothetical protein VFJ58_27775 [Armatimonadota bacterium]|nr:hypothetical protein [Armatimonadota bacterium]